MVGGNFHIINFHIGIFFLLAEIMNIIYSFQRFHPLISKIIFLYFISFLFFFPYAQERKISSKPIVRFLSRTSDRIKFISFFLFISKLFHGYWSSFIMTMLHMWISVLFRKLCYLYTLYSPLTMVKCIEWINFQWNAKTISY